jgi:hypothetical protein
MTNHDRTPSIQQSNIDTSSPRRKTFTPQRKSLSSDSEKVPKDPKSIPLRPLDVPLRPTIDFPPMKTITLIYQRNTPPKPRGLHIPFWGRKRTRSKRIPLDRLWEIHYRLERLKKAGLPLSTVKPPAAIRGRNAKGKTNQRGNKNLSTDVYSDGDEGRERVRRSKVGNGVIGHRSPEL